MTKTKRHSRGHTRSYFGEFDAQPLLDWLNRKDRAEANDDIEKLIRLNEKLGDARSLVFENPTQEIQATVAAVVRRFKVAVAPVVEAAGPGNWEVDWKLVGKLPPSAGLAFVRLLHTASRGLLDRVRQCAFAKCGKWFFARFSHQECCSSRCQQNRVRSTEQWKKNKREYMQRLRAEKKQREKRQLELSKSKRRERGR